MTKNTTTYFNDLSKDYMTEESNADFSNEIVLHKHPWRSQSKNNKPDIYLHLWILVYTF